MTEPLKRRSSFWQELKRRNLVRRNTVYAATAFVILEVVSIISDPLKLPDWTLLVVIILLSIGFIVSILISWNYELNQEGNLERIRPVQKELADLTETMGQNDQQPANTPAWKIASIVSFVVILALIVFNIFNGNSRKTSPEIIDKSIAVIPFINDSPEKENEYFINGTMEAILDNLSRIEELRVVSRTSVEKYRGPGKPSIPQIARELNVGYILEGSGQKSGDQIRLFVQLLDGATDKHLWSENFTRKIEDIFALQTEIARQVALELETIVTADEEELISRIPTTSQAAYEFYQKGLQEFNKYWADKSKTDMPGRAEILFRYALEYDSTYAGAYVQLAKIYSEKYWSSTDAEEAAMDSVFHLADRAIHFDKRQSDAYEMKGWYYYSTGRHDLAVEAYNKALRYNPNDYKAMRRLGSIYRVRGDVLRAMEYYFRGIQIESSAWYVREVYSGLAYLFMDYGFKDLSIHFLEEEKKLDMDQFRYYFHRARIEDTFGEFQAAGDYALEGLALDTMRKDFLEYLGVIHMMEKQYDSSYAWYRKIEERFESQEWSLWFPRYYGYILAQKGLASEGEKYIEEDFQRALEMQSQDKAWNQTYIVLAEIHAYRGEKEKAIEYLRILSGRKGLILFHINFLRSPLIDPIRDDPEFQEILKEMKSIIQGRHDEISQWLEKNDHLLP